MIDRSYMRKARWCSATASLICLILVLDACTARAECAGIESVKTFVAHVDDLERRHEWPRLESQFDQGATIVVSAPDETGRVNGALPVHDWISSLQDGEKRGRTISSDLKRERASITSDPSIANAHREFIEIVEVEGKRRAYSVTETMEIRCEKGGMRVTKAWMSMSESPNGDLESTEP